MADDYVALKGLKFHGLHGVHDFEKKEGNQFEIDAFFYADLNRAGKTDELQYTPDYSKAYEIIKTVMEGPSRNLMERLLDDMAKRLLPEFPEVHLLELIIRKNNPPLDGPCEASEIRRSWQNT